VADTLGAPAVETFIEGPKQEGRVDRLYGSGAGAPGYGGAAKKTAACTGMMALWYTIAAFHGVVGMFAATDAVLCVRNAMTIAG